MVDTARQLLDELMGRNRNLDPSTAICRKINWDDPEVKSMFVKSFIFSGKRRQKLIIITCVKFKTLLTVRS